MIFKNRLVEVLEHTTKSQKTIAEECGIHPSCITQYKKGDTQPTLDVLFRLCKSLDVSADYLLGLSDY